MNTGPLVSLSGFTTYQQISVAFDTIEAGRKRLLSRGLIHEGIEEAAELLNNLLYGVIDDEMLSEAETYAAKNWRKRGAK
jgi:hypothetical protein